MPHAFERERKEEEKAEKEEGKEGKKEREREEERKSNNGYCFEDRLLYNQANKIEKRSPQA